MSKDKFYTNVNDDQLTIHEAKLADIGHNDNPIKGFSDVLIMTAYFDNKEKKNGKFYIGGTKK